MPKKQKSHNLSSSLRRLVEYWSRSVVEGEQSRLTLFDVGSSSREIPLEDMKLGRCDQRLFRTLATERGRPPRSLESGSLRVLVCPLRYRKVDRDEPGPMYLELLWVPAELRADGTLHAPRTSDPFISRPLLEPAVSPHTPAIADMEDIEKFFERSPAPRESWRAFFQHSMRFFSDVTGKPADRFQLEGYEARPNGLILPDSGSSGGALTRIYDDILSGARPTGLLSAVAPTDNPKRGFFDTGIGSAKRQTSRHLGHFDGRFALAPSQRRAVHCFFDTPEGSFLTVTGPPGTGKTTFIQSVVASLWVRAAARGDESPPIVVACGATNQSMTNIIDSFEKAESPEVELAERWLPGVKSFGTYCCSERKAQESEFYQLELRSGSGLSASMMNDSYLAEAAAHFLSRYNRSGRKATNPAAAAKQLQREIRKIEGEIYSRALSLKNGTIGEWFKRLVGAEPWPDAIAYDAGLAAMDIPLRHRAFLLSSHYWEATWLVAASRELKRRRNEGDAALRFRRSRSDWAMRAMITPAFVATLSMACRFFGGKPEAEGPLIDLLIFDEAGQIPPELGAGLCALAKKGLFVGDDLQLEPVWNVSEHVDRSNAVEHGLLKAKDGDRWEKLAERGVLASRSNFMELAIRSSPKLDGNTLGVFLSEHRRSVPEIVAFCNQLAYRGRLQPCRPAPQNRLLPPFGYVDVQGVGEQRGSSRLNRAEAKEIAGWLARNEQALLSFYATRYLSDIVAVISPFAAQINELERLLERRYPGMTVGTIHSLQGAERPVVLFSAVYDSPPQFGYAFDRGINMLNVAVSRAKDSFIVFGRMSIFNPEAATPSGLLARYLFQHPHNELTTAAEREQELPKLQTTRLSTLSEHREILLEALTSARERVIIVSPTISISALRHDRLDKFIKEARTRGVQVTVYTDLLMDERDGVLQERAVEGRHLIVEAGADLHVVDRIHNKSLVIDNHTLVEGSFNWLSASRRENSTHQNFETSTCHRGPAAAEMIRELMADMKLRADRAAVKLAAETP